MSGKILIRLIAAISLSLTGCALSPIDSDQSHGNVFSAEQPDDWRASGRFTYTGPEDRQSGQFDWQQQGTNYQVRLFGPLGMGSFKIIGSSLQVEIQSGDESYISNQPDALLFELTGMDIPIEELSDWMTGGANAGEAASQDWQVLYDDYQLVGDYLLPSRIDIAKDSTSMRIAVADWNLELDD